MIEAVLGLVPVYGLAVVFLVTFTGCLGLPVPGSLALLAAGSFSASGDLVPAAAIAAGLAGALLGDQAGYWLGAAGTERAAAFAERRGMSGALARARQLIGRFGGAAVFFTRWLLAPIGPAVNLVGGMTAMSWRRFTVFDVAGEIVWVGLYFGLGYAFSRDIVEIAAVSGDLVWMLAAAAVSLVLALRLRSVLRTRS